MGNADFRAALLPFLTAKPPPKPVAKGKKAASAKAAAPPKRRRPGDSDSDDEPAPSVVLDKNSAAGLVLRKAKAGMAEKKRSKGDKIKF